MTHVARSTVLVAMAAFLAACAEAPLQPADDVGSPRLDAAVVQGSGEAVMPGEVLVRVRSGAAVEEVALAHGLAFGQAGYAGRFAVIRGAAGSERAAAAVLRGDSRVEWAEPNYLRQPTAIDPKLWAFVNPGGLNMRYTTGGKKGQLLPSTYASLPDADEDNVEGYASGGAPVEIGSIDTGVDFAHPQLAGRLVAGRDWYGNDNDPADTDGHGSHTTGTMAGATVGVAGVSGAAANVTVYVQRVCGQRGCPTSAIVNAIYAAADRPGLVAINLSLGGTSESQAERDAIAYATGKGVLVIASAGNSGSGTVACPACDPNAISVAATTWQDQRASYSQYGPGLDISAPGGQCYSNTSPEGCIHSSYRGGGYAWLQGTSMAAPQVTGTAAIVASVTGLRGGQLRQRLLSTTDDLGAAGYDTVYGSGRLNSYRAVTGSSLPAGQ